MGFSELIVSEEGNKFSFFFSWVKKKKKSPKPKIIKTATKPKPKQNKAPHLCHDLMLLVAGLLGLVIMIHWYKLWYQLIPVMHTSLLNIFWAGVEGKEEAMCEVLWFTQRRLPEMTQFMRRCRISVSELVERDCSGWGGAGSCRRKWTWGRSDL